MVFIYGLYYAAISHATLRADQNLPVSVRQSIKAARSHAGRFVWLLVLRAFLVAAPLLLCLLAFTAAAIWFGTMSPGNARSGALFLLIPLGVLAYCGCMVYAAIATLRLALAFPACLQEDLSARQAIARSGSLTHGAKGRIFLALLIIYAIGYAAFLAFYAVAMVFVGILAFAGAANFHTASPALIALAVLLGVVAGAIVLLWSLALMAAYSLAYAVFYRDQCLRKDGPPLSAFPQVDPV